MLPAWGRVFHCGKLTAAQDQQGDRSPDGDAHLWRQIPQVQALLLEITSHPPGDGSQQCKQLWFHVSPRSLSDHQFGSPPTDLHREIRAAVPGIDLAHAGKEQPGDGRLDGGDITRVVHQWDGLGIFGAEQPGFAHPVRAETRVELRQRRQETFQQLFLAEVEILVLGFQIIANINDVLAAEVFRRDEIGMLYQRQEGEAGRLGQVVPVIAFFRKSAA